MSLVLHYAMNTSVDADLGLDSSGSSLDATNTNVTSFDDPTYGRVAYFNGTDTSLVLDSASVPTAMTSNSARTISFWMRRISANNGIISSVGNQTSLGRRHRIQMLTSDQVDVAYFNTPASTIVTSIGTGWRHVAITADSGTSKGFLDGVQEYSEGKSVSTAVTDLGIGIDTTGGSTVQYDGYLLDYRVYDAALDVTALGVIFAAGPEVGFFIKATMYTHLADLEWGGVVDGASTYTVTQTEDAGPETIILDAVTDSLIVITSDTLPGSSYVYSIYSDLDLVTPAATTAETADLVTTLTVQNLLTRISNDITTLTETAATEIDGELRNALVTGDVLVTDIGDATFVSDAGTLALPFGPVEKVLVPFDTGEGASQQVTITLPDETDEILTYVVSPGEGEVISGGIQYAVGEFFKSGTYKVTVKTL